MKVLVLRTTDETGKEEVVPVEVSGSPGSVLAVAYAELGEDIDFTSVQHPEGRMQVMVHGQGLIIGLPTNVLATKLVYPFELTQQGYRIAGTAVLAGYDQIGDPLDVPEWARSWIEEQTGEKVSS